MHYLHSRQPHSIASQLLNLKQRMQPITRSIDGAVFKCSLLSSFMPSPHMGAFDWMSYRLQFPFYSHLGHWILDVVIMPLQNDNFKRFLHFYFLHFSFNLTFIGESMIWITLFGATSYIHSMGLPSETLRVVNRCLGWQFSSVWPSGPVTLIQSIVFLTTATLSIST